MDQRWDDDDSRSGGWQANKSWPAVWEPPTICSTCAGYTIGKTLLPKRISLRAHPSAHTRDAASMCAQRARARAPARDYTSPILLHFLHRDANIYKIKPHYYGFRKERTETTTRRPMEDKERYSSLFVRRVVVEGAKV